MTQPAMPIGGAGQPIIGGADPIGGLGPRISDFGVGRLLAIIPLRIERNVPGVKPGDVQDRITADIVAMDGGPLIFGGSEQKGTPHNKRVDQFPYLAVGCLISQKILVSQLERKVGVGIVVGRLTRGEAKGGNNAPWQIDLNVRPEEIAAVTQWWQLHSSGQFQNPRPVDLIPTPVTPQFGYGAPATYGQSMGGQMVPLTSNFGGQPVGVAQLQPPSAPPAFGGFVAQPAPAPAQMDWTLNTMPPGVPTDQLPAWQSQTTREQREQILATAGITGPNVAPGQPTGL